MRMAALDAAMNEAAPSSLKAGERLRALFGPQDAAWAVTQAELRRKAAGKFSRSADMLFTVHGLEQATREDVARWRAARFVAAGVEEVWDLGCGIGADAMAFAEARLRVVGVEQDPETAAVARHNLSLVGGGEVHVAAAEEVTVPLSAAVFLDPARRTARGRTWNVADFTPSWEFVLDHLGSGRFTCVKLGPGVPKELLPAGVQTCFVSHRGDGVEASLWSQLQPGTRAVLLGGGAEHELAAGHAVGLDVRPAGRFILEPDGAVIRAGLFEEVAPGRDVWLLDARTAYLSASEEVISPYVTCFEVVEVLDHDVRRLRAWVREHAVGTLEIKKRGIEADPAALRRQLKPKGPNHATIILARTVEGTRAFVCRRT